MNAVDVADSGPRSRAGRDRLLAPGRGLALTALSLVAAVIACLAALAGSLLIIGVGAYVLPATIAMLRSTAQLARGAAARWGGVDIIAPYRCEPAVDTHFDGRLEQCRHLLAEPATWRDFLWSCLDWLVGGVLSLVSASLIIYGLFGVAVQPFVWGPIDRAGGSNWYTAIHVDSTATAIIAIPIGVALIAAGLWVGPHTLRAYARWTAILLAPTRTARLERRVVRLTDTRAAATDSQAAELRRIERDLHDGAQARLVAVGMNLGKAAQLLDDDPAAARKLLLAAQEASSQALQELRDLVRGIHPPVLADRGIADAVLALSLESALHTEVRSTLSGRPLPSIESAAYFAVSELLTNAAKHGARSVCAVINHDCGLLEVSVIDDGPGGADPARGSGLRGVGRRLATFDGTMTVTSPDGGPTTVNLEIPCVLYSPKTSSS